MSLRPQPPLPPVPEDTARVARAAFRRGNPCLLLRDRLGAVFADADFADLYPALGQPAYAPWRLALVTLLQFREGLSDRQAAEAVRGRIDWKYLLALDLADAGFDFSVLCEFRGRLLQHEAAERLLARVLDAAREGGLLKARGRQRTGSTHVLAAVRDLNRIELLAETLRAALNAIAAAAPDWLRALSPPEWHERYDRRIEDMRLPETGPKRDAYVAQVGQDGFRLLDVLDGTDAPQEVAALPAVAVLRRVWARHFERPEDGKGGGGTAGGARLRAVQGRGPGDRVESPYDTDARFRAKAGTGWTGYMAHFTETCDEGAPHLVVHVDTTPANVHEARRTGPIHAALAAKGLTPSEHLVDSAYVSADHVIAARARHGIDLVGPTRRDLSWQGRDGEAFSLADFAVDWDGQVARCPEGRESAVWVTHGSSKRPHGRALVQARFHPADCRACPSRSRCTRSSPRRGRYLNLQPRCEHETLVAARARESTAEYRRLYAQRQGIEGTMSQGVRAFGLRQARYRGLAKTGLQHVATAAAINLDRLAAWLAKRPLAPTRVSRFAALAA
jgi:transposase